MLHQFDEYAKKHIEKIDTRNNLVDSERILTETTICAQKTIRQLEEMMAELTQKSNTIEIAKLLLLSVQLELLYKTIRKIKHEYSL